MSRFYKQGSIIIDLHSVDCIEWAGSSCPIVINSTYYIHPEYCDETAELDLDELCQLRHDQLVERWKSAKGGE